MRSRTFFKAAGIVSLLLVAISILAACGTSTATTSPTPTPNATATVTANAHKKAPQPAFGTIQQYDTASATLTIKAANGTTQTFQTKGARVLKSQKITQQQLTTLLGINGVRVLVSGKKNTDGSYAAQTLVASAITPSPAAIANFRGIDLQNVKMQNNQLTGTNQAGKTITVTIDGTVTLFQQSTATAVDLQVGQAVSVTPKPDATKGARLIIVGDLLQAAS